MKILFKLIAIALLTILCTILFHLAGRTFYYPVTVSIELKSEQNEVCQLFYSTTSSFNETQSIRKPYKEGDSFRKVTFSLPLSGIQNLRIDPGIKSQFYEIKQITIRVGKQIQSYSGSEILSNFTLTNLVYRDSLPGNSVILTQTNNTDVQMLYKYVLNEKFEIVNYSKKKPGQIFIILMYLVFVGLFVIKGNRINDFIGKILKSVFSFLKEIIIFTPTRFNLSITLLLFLKLILVSARQMTAFSDASYDDALFIKLAYSIGRGEWLGPYDSFTLIKGFGYPMFISIVNSIGIPLFFAQHLLFGYAAFIMVKALSPLLHKSNWEIALFAILLFNPVTSDSQTTRILRDDFFISMSVIIIAAFIAIYLRRNSGINSILKWAVLAGVVLFIQQNTREEGFVFLPFILILTILTIAKFKTNSSANQFHDFIFSMRKKWSLFLIVIFLPYLMLTIGNLTISSINFLNYGDFIRNEIKSKSFSGAYSALSKIETDSWNINVPVSKEARMRAYQVSPTFLELKDYLESENNGWRKCGNGDSTEIKGAWFMWALRSATSEAGYHENLPKSEEFYKKIEIEINTAFKNGKLKKKKNISFLSFTWDNRFTLPTIRKLKTIVHFVSAFQGYSPYPIISTGNSEGIEKFQNITGEVACTALFTEIEHPLSSLIKFYMLKTIAKFYSLLNPIFFIISVLLFVCLTFLLLIKRMRLLVWDGWLLTSVFLVLALSRMVLIAFVSVSQWEAVNMHYLGPSYPFLLLFEFFIIFAVWQLIYKKRKT